MIKLAKILKESDAVHAFVADRDREEVIANSMMKDKVKEQVIGSDQLYKDEYKQALKRGKQMGYSMSNEYAKGYVDGLKDGHEQANSKHNMPNDFRKLPQPPSENGE